MGSRIGFLAMALNSHLRFHPLLLIEGHSVCSPHCLKIARHILSLERTGSAFSSGSCSPFFRSQLVAVLSDLAV